MLGTVRLKIIANCTLVLLIVGSATFYTGLASSQLARSVVIFFRDNLLMEDLRQDLDQTEEGLTGYLTAKSSDSLKDYIRNSSRLSEHALKLNRAIRTDDYLLLQRDLAGTIDAYLEDANASVSAKRGRDVKGYSDRFELSLRDAELSRLLITRIEGIFISDSLKAFSGFNARISSLLATNAVLVAAATFMGLALLVAFSYKLTRPLSRLAEAAMAVGRGEYDHELPAPESNDEIATTTAAFSSMQASIRQAFEELKSKSEVEKRLMEERVRVLDMDHKLKASELLALQTQINPHFMFNTLSAGMQLALSEDAERTADFLETLAVFIRYALQPPSRQVEVADEIECVERYIWLLRLRFLDRFKFEVHVDEEALRVHTPALLLQPLVENAVTRGLKDREEGGTVRVSVRLAGQEAILTVEDNGDGMSEAEIQRILREEPGQEILHTGGIGLRNVIRRVTLATNGKGHVELISHPAQGMSVRIHLPVGVES